MTTSPTPYRPARRGLLFGLLALGIRAATVAVVFTTSVEFYMHLFPWINTLGTLVALVGVGYSAIAAHRREWGATLVLAFVCSVVAAVFDIVPFAYTTF